MLIKNRLQKHDLHMSKKSVLHYRTNNDLLYCKVPIQSMIKTSNYQLGRRNIGSVHNYERQLKSIIDHKFINYFTFSKFYPFSSVQKYISVPFSSFQFLSVSFSSFQFLSVPFSSFQFLLVPFSSFQFLSVPFSFFQFLSVPFGSFQFLPVPFSSYSVYG